MYKPDKTYDLINNIVYIICIIGALLFCGSLSYLIVVHILSIIDTATRLLVSGFIVMVVGFVGYCIVLSQILYQKDHDHAE